MFGKKRTREDVEQYVSSILLPGETVEVLQIGGLDPAIDFSAVTSHRLIVTAIAGGGGLLVRSIPFDRIASISITHDREAPLDPTSGSGVIVYPLGPEDHFVISAPGQETTDLHALYDALLHKLCAAGAPAMA
ncbi:MAG TPA: hypothetical protein VGH79_06565 [Gaiellaceae bacterium]